ncbi:MAG: hypothetical protein CL992_03095 [Euryarchaeota archaeon]|nr:hypothetical protein [Euryarchaeota archaeon]
MAENKRRNWNTIWRWLHIIAALPIIVYFGAISNFGYDWSDSMDSLVANYFIWLLMWTGIAKWQLPRYRKWKRKRTKAKEAAGV